MKALIIGNQTRFEKNISRELYGDFYDAYETFYVDGLVSDAEKIAACPDADVIVVDAVRSVSREVIENLPNLKLIHSEGVGFNAICTEAASERKIPVCNCKGLNSKAVAEHAVMLSIGLLRGVVTGHIGFLQGQQEAIKQGFMQKCNLKELADCKIGLLGFGDIAREAAKMFNVFGCEVFYNSRHRVSPEIEAEYNVTYKTVNELASTCDIISIHVPVTNETTGMIDAKFLSKMPVGSYIINTARGEIVNENDLVAAIASGHIAGAGLDTIIGEPIGADNHMLHLPKDVSDKIIFSCHVAGITSSAFKRAAKILYNNLMAVSKGEPLNNIVNHF